MTLISAYTDIKAYVVSAVKTAWTVTAVVAEFPEDSIAWAGTARVQCNYPIQLTPQVVHDEALMSFTITGRFSRPAAASMDLAVVDKASSLRAQLLSTNHPASIGYQSVVTSVSDEGGGSRLDDLYEVTVVYECMVRVDR